MKIAFRVDASPAMGIGHLRRCLALASALQALGASIVFVTRRLGIDTESMIAAHGFESRLLAAPADGKAEVGGPPHAALAGVPQLIDADETRAALAHLRADWLVVDHYSFDARWHERAAHGAPLRVCVVDDLGDRPLRADVLVDHNPAADHRAKYAAHASEVRRLLGGPRYALLGPSYAGAARYEFKPDVGSIGIFMGGTDILQLSALAVKACRDIASFDGPIQVATTSANPHLDDLRRRCRRSGSTELLVDLPDLAGFFRRHGLQIGAGGGATWERCCIGAPTLTLKWADNHSVVLDALETRGLVRTSTALTFESVGYAIAALIADSDARRSLSEKSRELVDGSGAERVAVALFADAVSLRSATPADAELAHAWRNDERTRRYFRDPAPVPLADHLGWWTRTLRDDRRWLLVASCGNRPVGSIRFDFTDDAAEVSLYVDPALTGLGLGRALLGAAQHWIAVRAPRTRRVVAEVRPDNTASVRAFRAAGFSPAQPQHWVWEARP